MAPPQVAPGCQAIEDAVELFRRRLLEARRERVSGRLTLEVDLKDGGIVEKSTSLRRKER